MNEEDKPFTFDVETKNVLDFDEKPKAGRKPKHEKKRKRQIACYLNDEEYSLLMNYLDGRPAGVFIRNTILEKIKNNLND